MSPSVGGMGRLALLASLWSATTYALDFDICASFNTGSTKPIIDNLQSNGLCHDTCIANFAYSITQGKNCWCSDYTPAEGDQVSKSSCSTKCPGYPFEFCGAQDRFSYIRLGNVKPKGTRGSNSGSKPKPDPSTKDSGPSTTDSPSPSKTDDNDESSTTSEAERRPTTSIIQTITVGQAVKTVTIIPTETAGDNVSGDNDRDASQTGDSLRTGKSDDGGGLDTGSLVGIIVGVIAAVLIAAGIVLFFFLRRRKRNQQGGYHDDPSIRGSSSGRMGPAMSQAGGSPSSPNSAGNRNSMLQVDPRMDPFKEGLYGRNNGSAESINTLRDEHDYSRRIQQPKVLRAMNPDPEGGHE